MKSTKIIYWVTTFILFITQGLITALMFNNAESAAGFKQLGYPEYFRVMNSIFKIVGALVLIVPYFKGRYKEWAYAGFGIDFIAATVSIWVTMGFGPDVLLVVAFMGILVVSYISYNKLQTIK
ncbi:MAG: DoxX family protein [Flavobacterium sp.]|nr:DoxX family protein [Flavobacterium sp.]